MEKDGSRLVSLVKIKESMNNRLEKDRNIFVESLNNIYE